MHENTKHVATQIIKWLGLKFDEIKFRKERPMRTDFGYSGRRPVGQTYRGGRVDIARNYNPSERGYFRGVNHPDGSMEILIRTPQRSLFEGSDVS